MASRSSLFDTMAEAGREALDGTAFILEFETIEGPGSHRASKLWDLWVELSCTCFPLRDDKLDSLLRRFEGAGFQYDTAAIGPLPEGRGFTLRAPDAERDPEAVPVPPSNECCLWPA